ncbi:Uncharacterized conserved protein, FlaG/YvyC family [Humidesulfovibrio mexicanus]|jgi:uncharacterized FlaG/YvyC family protein|uniref:Uncharacterized conserved protein, FlaG/YvyC family n=1 Tax=Humidesulfovibrio mexicanus TaxID=147047 RepID=A0A238XU25_9BACT|nr:flagellar protein FlaG [Humidesulfovibrio mexicanus]SNR62556.1 Uncharacterized conserved protein, FlaG/YvyC family [Humidesulfovibrio mexicanus]
MNISPSDMDVRQGFSPARQAVATHAQSVDPQTADTQRSAAQATVGQQATRQTASQEPNGTDARSQAVAATADRTTALGTAQILEQRLNATGTALKIRVLDNSEDQIQVEIVDTQSNKVLRKIPQDELLKLSASIKEMTGVLLNNPA